MSIEGFVTVKSVLDSSGKILTPDKAVKYGWIKPGKWPKSISGHGIGADEIPLGSNTMVDNGRQMLAYLFGGRTPSGSYRCSRFGIGTGTSPTTSSFTDLESPIEFYDDGSPQLKRTKPIANIDYPVPFVARVEFSIGLTEAVGMLITELGLYASDLSGTTPVLLARKVETGIEKTSDFAPTLLWRVRF